MMHQSVRMIWKIVNVRKNLMIERNNNNNKKVLNARVLRQ